MTNAPALKSFNSLMQIMQAFPDEQSAVDHFTAIRWKNGAYCPHCKSTRVYHFSDNRTHKCGGCRKRLSTKVGTGFEETKIELRKWLAAIWLLTSHKKGIASTQLAKDIDVTQKTAWFMTQRLRHALETKSFDRPLSGAVEADEMYHGGKEKNKHAWQRTGGKQGGAGKIAVLGLLERDGELRTGTVPNVSKMTVQGIVRQHVQPGSAVMTDEHMAYRGLSDAYFHHTVSHSAGEYVRHYTIHSNGIESVWALFRRQIVGTHHYLSPKHVNRYLGEMTWRFNRREMNEGDRVNALLAQASGRLTYKALTA